MLSVVVSRRPSVEEGSRSKASKATRARREGGAWEGESARGRRVPGRCRGVGDAASARVARVATRGTRGVRDEVCGRGGITRIFPRASWTIFVPRERGGKARFGWAVIGSRGTQKRGSTLPHIIFFPRASAAGATNAPARLALQLHVRLVPCREYRRPITYSYSPAGSASLPSPVARDGGVFRRGGDSSRRGRLGRLGSPGAGSGLGDAGWRRGAERAIGCG